MISTAAETADPERAKFFQARLALAKAALEASPSAVLFAAAARAHWDCGEPDAFVEAFRAGCRLDASKVWLDLTRGAEVLEAQVDALVAAGLLYPVVLSAKAHCEAWRGRPEGVRRLTDVDRLVAQYEAAAPDGLSQADFHQLLLDEIQPHAVPPREGAGKALYGGRRDDGFFGRRSPARDLFLRAVQPALDRYLASLPDDPDNLFLRARPADFAVDGWAIIVTDEGYTRSHIHPKAWLNGVYYLSRPDETQARKPKGWLEVRRPETVPETAGWDERLIEPVPGTLVLMPGHFTHRTHPTQSDQERACIVFNLSFPELTARRTSGTGAGGEGVCAGGAK